MSNFQNSMCVGLTLLLTVFLTVQSRTLISTTKAQDYLNVTGELDEAKLNLMSVQDSGVADKVKKTNKPAFGIPWSIKNLSYNISKYSKHLTKADIDTEIARAFSLWSKYSDLTFTQKKSGQVNIDIKFLEGEHICGDSIDDFMGILAHAVPPQKNCYIHFNDAHQWTINSRHGANLFQVAVHEMGHTLGLNHSNMFSSIMYEFAPPYIPNFKLDQDAIERIQALYGKTSSITPHLCQNHKIDAVFTSLNGETIVLKCDQYYLINGQKFFTNAKVIANEYPNLIPYKWPHLPAYIDAAFTNVNGDHYFFKNDKVWIYSNDKLNDGYPRLIREIFPSIPNDLDAVLHLRKTNEYFFFKGNMSYYINASPGKMNTRSFSINMLNLPSNIDAAFEDGKGNMYAFKNDEVMELSKSMPVVERTFKFNDWLPEWQTAKP